MATTTTNYGFDIPQSTDLVKDGATAIATLGQDIDTAMNTALGTKKAGMVLLNTTSFSGVSSVSLPANTFSATYDNYRIVCNIDTSSATAEVAWRLRAAGSDNSSSNYTWTQVLYNSNASPGSSITGSNGLTTWSLCAKTSSAVSNFILDIFNPFATKKAQGFSMNISEDGATGTRITYFGGGMSVTTSYDSLSLVSTSGTITGSYSVFGVNK
jgi:hypothetical protein